MSPDDFTFTLTVPADARFVAVVRDLTLHAANYAKLAQADGWALADRVVASVERRVKAGSECRLRYKRRGGRLTVDLGGDSIARHP